MQRLAALLNSKNKCQQVSNKTKEEVVSADNCSKLQ